MVVTVDRSRSRLNLSPLASHSCWRLSSSRYVALSPASPSLGRFSATGQWFVHGCRRLTRPTADLMDLGTLSISFAVDPDPYLLSNPSSRFTTPTMLVAGAV
jgi:hypothetical protein